MRHPEPYLVFHEGAWREAYLERRDHEMCYQGHRVPALRVRIRGPERNSFEWPVVEVPLVNCYHLRELIAVAHRAIAVASDATITANRQLWDAEAPPEATSEPAAKVFLTPVIVVARGDEGDPFSIFVSEDDPGDHRPEFSVWWDPSTDTHYQLLEGQWAEIDVEEEFTDAEKAFLEKKLKPYYEGLTVKSVLDAKGVNVGAVESAIFDATTTIEELEAVERNDDPTLKERPDPSSPRFNIFIQEKDPIEEAADDDVWFDPETEELARMIDGEWWVISDDHLTARKELGDEDFESVTAAIQGWRNAPPPK